MKKNTQIPEITKIYKILDFYLRHVPLGLLPFMEHDIPLISANDLSEILMKIGKTGDVNIRVQGGKYIPEQQRIIEYAESQLATINYYGIDLIREVFSDAINCYPDRGRFFRLWSMKGEGIDGIKTVADIANICGYADPSAPYRMREKYLKEIAYTIFIRRRCSSKETT